MGFRVLGLRVLKLLLRKARRSFQAVSKNLSNPDRILRGVGLEFRVEAAGERGGDNLNKFQVFSINVQAKPKMWPRLAHFVPSSLDSGRWNLGFGLGTWGPRRGRRNQNVRATRLDARASSAAPARM